MDRVTLMAVGAALLTGLGLGVQATINGQVGTRLGPIGTGLLVMIAGGLVALVIGVALRGQVIAADGAAIRRDMVGIVIAGVLAIIAIVGTSYALPRAGVAAGIAAIILGQMIAAVIVDSTGVGGVEQIALSPARIGGLILLAAGVWLLLPRGG